MTQTELGKPFTQSYVSSIVHGRPIPSLLELLLFATRLQVPAGDILEAVKFDLPARYNPDDARRGGALSRGGAHG